MLLKLVKTSEPEIPMLYIFIAPSLKVEAEVLAESLVVEGYPMFKYKGDPPPLL